METCKEIFGMNGVLIPTLPPPEFETNMELVPRRVFGDIHTGTYPLVPIPVTPPGATTVEPL